MGNEAGDGKLDVGRSRGRWIWRFLGRLLVLVVAVLLLLDVLPWDWGPLVVPAVSPWVAICSAIAQRSVSWVVLLGLPVLVLSLVRRRWFCRYACPVGLLTEQAGRPMRWTRGACRRLPHVGRWIALMALAGACVGYPLLLWLDPLAIFGGFFSIWQQPYSTAALVPAIGLPIVLVLSFLMPGAWCLRVCPLGATQELLAWRASRRWAGQEPTAFDDESSEASGPSRRFPRRALVALGLGAGWAALAVRVLRKEASLPIRPPGAVADPYFSGLCVRCGNCLRACPAGILHPDVGEHGVASLLTPVVRIGDDYCREGCNRCTQVCPSGAIGRLTLDEKRQTRMAVAKVDLSICVLSDDHECQICRSHCPYEAIKIVWSDETYSCSPVVDPQKCPGCGACEVACITTPVKAIRVVSMEREEGKGERGEGKTAAAGGGSW